MLLLCVTDQYFAKYADLIKLTHRTKTLVWTGDLKYGPQPRLHSVSFLESLSQAGSATTARKLSRRSRIILSGHLHCSAYYVKLPRLKKGLSCYNNLFVNIQNLLPSLSYDLVSDFSLICDKSFLRDTRQRSNTKLFLPEGGKVIFLEVAIVQICAHLLPHLLSHLLSNPSNLLSYFSTCPTSSLTSPTTSPTSPPPPSPL